MALQASRRLGLNAMATFSGALAWPYVYPWPQRPAGLIETAFEELARRWRPILDVSEENGVDVCYEIHPGEDLFDGTTFELFLDRSTGTRAATCSTTRATSCCSSLDYLDYIDIYHERIKMFHVKDAEFNPTGRQGVYSGYSGWVERAGRFRSIGDGQVDFGADLLQARRLRLRRLGGGGVGMRAEASRGRRPRGGGVRASTTSSG